MALMRISDVAQELGVAEDRIRQWILDGSLSADGDLVDIQSARRLLEADRLGEKLTGLKGEIAAAQTQLKGIEAALSNLPNSFTRKPSWLERWGPLLLAIVAIGVAWWQLYGANTALKAQTEYAIQSDRLETYKLLRSSANVEETKTALTMYDAQIAIADRAANSSAYFPVVSKSFWLDLKEKTCSSWLGAVCNPTAYPEDLREDYPELVRICIPHVEDGSNACPM